MSGGDGKELFAAANAALNGTSAIVLVLAFVMIKRKRIRAHAALMITGVTLSAIFLISYITSYVKYGDRTSGLSASPLRTFYLVLLASHVLLAVTLLPMIVTTVRRAAGRRFDLHRRIAKPTFWIWLYVSVTGVIVYWMLYHLFPSIKPAG